MHYRTDQLLVVEFQELLIVFRRVGIMQDTGVFNRNLRHGNAEPGERAVKAVLSGIIQKGIDQAAGDQNRMAGLAIADRAGQIRLAGHHRPDCVGSEERNVHRREQNTVTFVLYIVQADPDRVKHLRRCILLIAQEDNSVAGQMPLQQKRLIAGHHDDLADTGLAERRHHPLGDGDGSDIEHGLEITHS